MKNMTRAVNGRHKVTQNGECIVQKEGDTRLCVQGSALCVCRKPRFLHNAATRSCTCNYIASVASQKLFLHNGAPLSLSGRAAFACTTPKVQQGRQQGRQPGHKLPACFPSQPTTLPHACAARPQPSPCQISLISAHFRPRHPWGGQAPTSPS